MSTYAFILGRKNQLSIAELCAVLGKQDKIIEINAETLIADLSEPLTNPQYSLNRLGGVIKIVELISELPVSAPRDRIALEISAHLFQKFKDHETKFKYGISAYSLPQKPEQFLNRILNLVKKSLTADGLKSRFINKNFNNLENAAIKGEKLLAEGSEIVIIQGRSKYFIGETVALQDFENYSKRDFDRPARDAKLGMLPPKLAQILINLAGLTSLQEPIKSTIYDPFVGVGTIPTEALLLGFKVIGSDISSVIIEKSRKNIDWTIKEFNISQPDLRLFAKDATTLITHDLPEKVDAIVTESYLGPPQAILPSPGDMAKIFSNITSIVTGFFQAIHPILKPGTPVIITFPAYRDKGRFHFIEDLPYAIEQLGFSAITMISEEIINNNSLRTFERKSLIYDRPDQVVGREIWKFIRK